jgi:diguanylate cyclase (GGDEF)-like protein
MARRSTLPHSGDGRAFPSRLAGRTGRAGSTARFIVLASLLAVVPVVLATIAFGQLFRASERDRVDSRLALASRLALDRVEAAQADATAAARSLAVERAVQLALARRDTAALERAGYTRGTLTVTATAAGAAPPARQTNAVTRTVLVGTLGRVDAAVHMGAVLARIGRQTHTQLLLAAPGGEWSAARPARQPHDVHVRGVGYRALRERAAGLDVVAFVPASDIGSSVRHRALLTLAAAALTIVAIALAALLLAQRRKLGTIVNERRSPVALFGDVVAAAHDSRALLPVILETAVAAVDAAGGRVQWDGEEIASIGSAVRPGGVLTYPLDNEEEGTDRQIVLYPQPGGFSSAQREVAAALVAQGRIALENARLHSLIRRQAVTDELTDLANRRRFMEVLQQEVARAARFGSSLALVLFDLDHFKQINDRCGHQAGDVVLSSAAAVMRARVRETDLPARVGGEEFAVILSGTDLEGACAVAEKLRHDLSEQVRVPIPDWTVTASFGVAVLHEGESAEFLVGAADRALYRAKDEGRNRVCTADTEPSAA